MSKHEVRAVKSLVGTTISHAPVVRSGPWLFLNGFEAFDPSKGLVPEIQTDSRARSEKSKHRREADFIVHRMNAVLGEFGAGFSRAVRLDQFYSTGEAVDPYHHARSDEFGKYIPPSTSIVEQSCLSSESSICASLIAYLGDNEIMPIFPETVPVPAGSGFTPVVIAGDFVFVAGQMASDINNELPQFRRSAWGGSNIREQTHYLIHDKLRPALKSANADLKDALKAQVYLSDLSDLSDFLDVWNNELDGQCALTVTSAKRMGLPGGCIEINLIALAPHAKAKKEIVRLPIPDSATFGPCVTAGEFIFPSALIADMGGDALGHGNTQAFKGLGYAAHFQAAQIYAALDAICKTVGVAATSIVRAQYFVDDLSDFAAVAASWGARYGDLPHPFICIQVPALGAGVPTIVADFWLVRDAGASG